MKNARGVLAINAQTGEQTFVANTATVEELQDDLIADVKASAERRILAVMPEYMQRNLTAQATIYLSMFPGVHPNNYPEPYRSEWMAGQDKWLKIKAIRDASNAIEAQIRNLVSAAEVFMFAETMEDNSNWPR